MEPRMRNMVATLALLCATLLIFYPCTSNANGQGKTPFFVFGDSLYDNGMSLYTGVKGAGAILWPYGEQYYLKKPAGRYSDGLVIPDFIAQFAGLPLLQPFLQPGNKNYTIGINFASSNACVLDENCSEGINLKMQLHYFVKMVQNLTRQVGDSEANRLLSKAVYLFNIGGEDYVTLFQKNINKLPLNSFKKTFYKKQILGNVIRLIRTVYDKGGRKFAFQNVGAIGCMPSIKYTLGFKGTCAQEPQELAKIHNAAFAALIKKLQAKLPELKYSIYDFYTALHERVVYGKIYGFKESETACCGSGIFNGEYTCQKVDRSFSVCNNLNDYLWLDALHPTHKAHRQFALEFWSGEPDVVAPYDLQTLFAMD